MKYFFERNDSRLFSRWIGLLPEGDLRKISGIVFVYSFLGVLDLLGIVGIGLIGSLSVSSLQVDSPSGRVAEALELLRISNFSFELQLLILGSLSITLLLTRTLLSIIYTKRILYFFGRRSAMMSANLVSRYLSQSLVKVQSRTSQEALYALTTGVHHLMIGVFATSVVLISDLILLLVLAVGLISVSPTSFFGSFLLFMFTAYVLNRSMRSKVNELASNSTRIEIKSSEMIIEVLNSFRELFVHNRRSHYSRAISELRFEKASMDSQLSFIPYIGKYVIESTIVFGAIIIGVSQFLLQDIDQALGTLAVFLAAGTRIAPAFLRAQQGSIQIRTSMNEAKPTLDLIDTLSADVLKNQSLDTLDVEHSGFDPVIRVEKLSLTYPGNTAPTLSDLSFSVLPGQTIAIVGVSGAGKTSLVDSILGILEPNSGSVSISGVEPQEAIEKWPGAISYVPQDVAVVSGTVRENVALGFSLEPRFDDLIFEALKIANLDEFVRSLPSGLDTEVGERGSRLSGGQRQRIGIARALFTRPKVLILDEATSALDAETERSISRAIGLLHGTTTTIIIAHRLSTIRNADVVAYLANGEIVAIGKFEEVRAQISDFDQQLKIMGL